MTAARRLLHLACHAAILVWLAAYLAWSTISRDAQLELASLEALEEIAKIQPRLEEPPTPPSREEPRPVQAETGADPAPEPTRIAGADIARGAAFLDGHGSFPMLSCSYEDFRSFRDYARAMVALGSRFVVVRQRQIVGEIDLETGRISEPSLDAAFSPRARDYTGEPAVRALASAARQRFGDGAIVMMLVPRALDAGLFGGIARVLSERGQRHADFREIRGRYERGGDGGVRLRVDEGVRSDGSAAELDLLFDLADVARAGAPSA